MGLQVVKFMRPEFQVGFLYIFFFLFYNFCLEMDEEVYLKEHRFCFAPGVPCGVEHLSF